MVTDVTNVSRSAVNNSLKLPIPNVKDGKTAIMKVRLQKGYDKKESTVYEIEVESGYCIRMRKDGEQSGFSFSPLTTDPIVFKDSHLTVYVSKESGGVYITLIVPDEYGLFLEEDTLILS